MRTVGTTSRGVRCPVVREGDNLVKIVTDAILACGEEQGLTFHDRDIVAVTEAVVARSQGNYAGVEDIAADCRAKFGADTVALTFPILSRNRIAICLKGIAKAFKKVYILMSYPSDEVGNHLFDEDLLDEKGVNPWSDVLDEAKYRELFGYEKGAFTGASKEGKMGVFESADKGTVFLDEVGDLPLEMQVHLLRVLQEMQGRRVGGVRSISVDVRIIAATNRNLLDMVHEKTFREDLYYRLNVVPIEIPPLRERKRDIRPLVESFLKDMNKKYRYQKRFADAAMEILYSYVWPGNVRELKNVVEQAVILSAGDEIQPSELPIACRFEGESHGGDETGRVNLKLEVARFEYEYICRAYEKYGTVRAAAASLGMDSATFVRKRRKFEELLQK